MPPTHALSTRVEAPDRRACAAAIEAAGGFKTASKKRVARLMREMGICGVSRR